MNKYIFLSIAFLIFISLLNFSYGFSNIKRDGETYVITSGFNNLTSILSPSSDSTSKQIIGQNDYLTPAFLEKAVKISNITGRIEVPNTLDFGTGFLISNSLFITNNHVLAYPEDTENSTVQFNYALDENHKPLPVDTYHVNKSIFYTNPDLDYTIVKLDGFPGKKWSFIPLKNIANPFIGNKTILIHYPLGGYKTISLLDGQVVKIQPNGVFLQYTSDTSKGSSGAPVFDSSWKLIALHHFEGDRDITGKYLNNEGIIIKKIVEDLKSKSNVNAQVKEIVKEANLN